MEELFRNHKVLSTINHSLFTLHAMMKKRTQFSYRWHPAGPTIPACARIHEFPLIWNNLRQPAGGNCLKKLAMIACR